jgi:hypothetical protein
LAVVLGLVLNGERRIAMVSCIFALLPLVQNLYFVKVSVSERTYAVKSLNSYIASITKEGDVLIGPWAPALTWEVRAHAYPIWAGFLGERDVLKYYKPDFIISEPNEEDSDGAYRKNDILLENISDEVFKEHIAEWDVIVYKVKMP